MARIIVPVADLRKKPCDLLPKTFDHNPLRESQLLYNENVCILGYEDGWVQVAAVEQPRFTCERGWHPYEGWVHRSEVSDGVIPPRFVTHSLGHTYSYGTYFDNPSPENRLIPKQFDRDQLIQEAHLFLGAPYLWGGRSAPLPGIIASVDCSGFIQLLYRAQGIQIPRDAHDQFLFGSEVADLLPGDPLYLAPVSSTGSHTQIRIQHVILKIAGDVYIEAPESGKSVRRLVWGQDIWEEENMLFFNDRPSPYLFYKRSMLSTQLRTSLGIL